jgi:hypothetical protein
MFCDEMWRPYSVWFLVFYNPFENFNFWLHEVRRCSTQSGIQVFVLFPFSKESIQFNPPLTHILYAYRFWTPEWASNLQLVALISHILSSYIPSPLHTARPANYFLFSFYHSYYILSRKQILKLFCVWNSLQPYGLRFLLLKHRLSLRLRWVTLFEIIPHIVTSTSL